MPSGQDFASRLRDETRRALAGRLLGFEEEFRILRADLSTLISSVDQLTERLGSTQSLDTQAVEAILAEALAAISEESIRKRDAEKSVLAHFAHDIRQKETQEEILNILLDGAHLHAPRVMLFVTRGSQFIGWSSRGFSEEAARHFGKMALSSSDSLLLRSALEADGLTTAEDISKETAIAQFLPEGIKGPWHAFPLKAIRRPAAVLLAMATSDCACDLESLCVLMDLTGLCIENTALKILNELKLEKPPAPAAAANQEVEESTIESVPAAAENVPESALEELPSTDEAEVLTPSLPAAGGTKEAAPAPETYAELPPEESESKADIPVPALPPPPEWETAPPSEEIAAATPSPESSMEEMPAAEVAPAAEAIAEEAQAPAEEKPEPVRAAVLREVQPLTEEEKLHADAKRFARLLASEIKLYNEQRVQEGRTNRDLYVRLKRDIDRSRDMYEKRVSPMVSRKVDYFHDEIVRILGDNDPSALGSDYPGPRVES